MKYRIAFEMIIYYCFKVPEALVVRHSEILFNLHHPLLFNGFFYVIKQLTFQDPNFKHKKCLSV